MSERFPWLATFVDKPGQALATHDGELSRGLFELADGAVLHWMFDADPETGERSFLWIHLTDEEALQVVKSDPRQGILESIRASLQDNRALMFVQGPDNEPVLFGAFRIPRTGSEELLVRQLFLHARSRLRRAATRSVARGRSRRETTELRRRARTALATA